MSIVTLNKLINICLKNCLSYLSMDVEVLISLSRKLNSLLKGISKKSLKKISIFEEISAKLESGNLQISL